jgi:hypothetical protein
MPTPSRHAVLLPNTTLTTTGTTGETINIEGFTAAIIMLKSDSGTGTSPTLNLRIQQGIRPHSSAAAAGDQPPAGGTVVWDDFAAFAQVTTSASTQMMRIVGGSNVVGAASSGSLAASTIRNGPLGSMWRVQYTIGGTNPSFANVSVVAQLIP